MTNTPNISIIVPVYNVEEYLTECLNSLINQTLKDIEIICVNDCSTDNSLSILKEFENADERVKIISLNVNLGVSVSRNMGIENASGEYIGFVDSDDFVDVDFFENLYDCAKKTDSDISCASVIRGNKTKKVKLISYEEEKIVTNTKEKYEICRVPTHCYVWNKIYKNTLLKNNNIKFLEDSVFEDLLFTPKVLEESNRLVTVPNVTYHYRKRKGSTIKDMSYKAVNDKKNNKKYLLKKCKEYNVYVSKKDSVRLKREYYTGIIKLLKIYEYERSSEYYLFGLIPFFKIKRYE